MKLFMVHCGFYDEAVGGGLFESHVNYFVAAETADSARVKAKLIPEFLAKRMHIDGLQEVDSVQGYRLSLTFDPVLSGKSEIISHRHRDLARPREQESL